MRNILLLLIGIGLTKASSILVDWSAHVLPSAQSYILDYTPPVGHPPAGAILPGNTRRALLNGTISTTEYTIYLSAIAVDGTRKNVTELTYFSGPDPPILDSIETTEREATISYFPPQGTDISYHIEYYPEGQQEYSNAVETKASLIRLRGLEPGTQFRLKIKSIFKGVRSQDSIEASFKTQGDPVYDYSSSAESFSVRTLPPDLDLATSTTPRNKDSYSYEVSAETSESSTESTTPVSTSTFAAFSFITLNPETTAETTTRTTSTTTAATIIPMTTQLTSEEEDTTTEQPATTVGTTTKTIRKEAEKIDAGDYEQNTALLGLEEMKKEYGEPGEIEVGEEDGMMRLDWTVPDGAKCDAFFLNYTILTLSRPKSFSVASSETYALIKMLPDHTLDLRVFCMLAGALSKTWWAHRMAYLQKPKPVEGLKVVAVETDEFYVSRVTLDWNRTHHDSEHYKVVVEYKPEKGSPTEIEGPTEGPLLIEKLEPAHSYKFTVRNESTELSLHSKPTEIEQVTPPLISSTVYPGQISSTAININFGESDPEQGRFDHYLLTFSGNNKNFSKKIEMNQERSLTFTKLIPGKTYVFQLYTVYKGVKSRAVTESVTTYPLKVNQLLPVVGADYVILYWDIENFADSDCRFRLSYNADKLAPVSVELKGSNYHKFGGLHSDTYYTFTITVIMGTGQAAAESESEMITVHVPRTPPPDPIVERRGSRELSVQFDHSIFSTLNGAVKNYAIIVSDDIDLHDDAYELKSWFEVHEEDTWGAYRASPSDYHPFEKQPKRAVFVVGSEDCVRRSLDEPFCNGILRAGVDYMVRLRAYTDTSVAIETDWVNSEGKEEEEEEDKNERRLPCHMYLNGCPRKKSSSVPQLLVSLMLFLMLRF